MAHSLRNWLRDVLATANGTATARTSGLPSTGNGASSFHARWLVDTSRAPIKRVSATCTIAQPPTVNRLYFWALQASFCDSTGRSYGGAHTGLQHNPRFPGNGALNWGGYADRGGELAGTPSMLTSTPNDANTYDYAWEPATPYQLTIEPGSTGWRALCTNLNTGYQVLVRELLCQGDRLDHFVVWTECFARCDDPSVTVVWSDFFVELDDGSRMEPTGFVASYEPVEQGGCSNTDTALSIDQSGRPILIQRTNCSRSNPAGPLALNQ
jgi:hypothetical protein